MLQVLLLGEQAIIDDSTGTVATRSPRTVTLIAFLVAHAGIPQSRQRIAELFWPDSTDAQALTNLRRELHHLRQVLGSEEALVVTAKDLCWSGDEAIRVDVRTFDIEHGAALSAAARGDNDNVLAHGAAALAAYRGQFLPGMYDDWILDARSELEQRCLEVCDLVGETRVRRGDLAGGLDVARRRITLRPYEEAGYRTLMALHVDLGDRASAISTYHHCASILERELDVRPDDETRKLFARLLTLSPAADAPLPAIASTAPRSGVAASHLVGRSREVDVLPGVWRAAAAGQPRLAVVRGSAGVGKSRLIAEIADMARAQGAVVAHSQCFGAAGRLALAPVADWLRNPAVQSAAAALDPVWQLEVDRLVPSGKGRAEPTADVRAMVDAWQRHRFFEGLARALICAGRPMLLVLDNIHWCDNETLTFLTFLLGLDPDAPILVAATVRNESFDGGTELADWTVRMRATGLLTDVTVGPLESDDTARLAEAISGCPFDGTDRDLLQATTGGFPLYVVEAARTIADVGDTSVGHRDLTAVLCDRLEHGTAAAREVAFLAAAVGRNFTLDLLTEASDLDADTVVQAVDEPWRRRIIHELRDGYDFSHDLLREAAYEQISPPKRWLLHRRIAQSLELAHANDTDMVSAQLAEQYARGGRPDRAVAYHERAAEIASGTFAHSEAIRLHREALSIVVRQPDGNDTRSHELAIVEAMAAPLNANYGFASPELQHVLERAIDLAETLGRKDSIITGLVGLWATLFVQGKTAAAHSAVTRALTMVDPESELSGSANFAFGGSSVSLGKPGEALQHFELAERLTRGANLWTVGTRPDVQCTAWAAHAHWLLGNDDAALWSAYDAIKLARAIEHPFSLAVALAYAGITFQISDSRAELSDVVAELRELCDRYGFAYYREWGLVLDGWGRADESGVELARLGIDHLRSEGSFARMPYWLSLLADAQGRAHQPEAARATLDAALVAGRTRNDVWWLPEVMRMRAAYDNQDAGADRLRAAAQLASDHGSVALLRRCERDICERDICERDIAAHSVRPTN